MSDPQPSFSSKAVANRFLDLAEQDGTQLTNMQLQKLVFLAHGFHLGLLHAPLTKDHVHAWEWGPVIPLLYKPLRKFGNGKVLSKLESEDSIELSSRADLIIRHVWKRYGLKSGGQLSTLTHLPGSPWDQVWNESDDKFGVIPDSVIEAYYKDRLLNA